MLFPALLLAAHAGDRGNAHGCVLLELAVHSSVLLERRRALDDGRGGRGSGAHGAERGGSGFGEVGGVVGGEFKGEGGRAVPTGAFAVRRCGVGALGHARGGFEDGGHELEQTGQEGHGSGFEEGRLPPRLERQRHCSEGLRD